MFLTSKKDKTEKLVKVEKVEEEPKTEEVIFTKKVEEDVMELKKVDVKIGESATIIGTMKGACIADIEGCFEGTIDLDGDLVLSKTGNLKADVKVRNAIISGNMDGTIYAEESVQIMPTAMVKGDITSKILVIERGAKFIGTSNIIEEDQQIRPKYMPTHFSTTAEAIKSTPIIHKPETNNNDK